MNAALLSGYDLGYVPLAKDTTFRMAQWAALHRMESIIFTHPPKGLNMYWTGVARGLELLRDGYDRVFYLDADQLITNLDADPTAGIPKSGFHCSKDWGKDAVEPWHFSMCGFLAHQDCIPLFEMVLGMEPEWRDKPFQEQGPFQDVVRNMVKDLPMFEIGSPQCKGLINIHPRKRFNCVPDAVCPGNVPEPWAPGDFAAHITMLPIEQRVQIAEKLFHV